MIQRDPTTLREIADAARLSVTTVSRILRGDYKGSTPKGRKQVALVSELAQRHGYIANSSARRLRDGRYNAVLVSLPVDKYGIPPAFAFEYLTGMNEALGPLGSSILLQTHRWRDPAGDPGALPGERAYDGALFLDEANPLLERRLAQGGVPVVHVNVEEHPRRVTLNRDERAVGERMVEALAALGYRRVLVVGRDQREVQHFSLVQRLAGVQAAAARLGLECAFDDAAWWSGGFAASIPATGVDRHTVVLTIEAYAVLALGRRLPPSVALACLDDMHVFTEMMPGLTRARFDRKALGRMAADLLLARMGDPLAGQRVTTVQPEIQVGTSTPLVSP